MLLYHVSQPETLIKRQSTRHDCLPSLLGDREKLSEIVCGEEKNILYKSSQGKTKISLLPAQRAQRTNQGWTPLYSFGSPFASVSTVGRGYPSLVSVIPPSTPHPFLLPSPSPTAPPPLTHPIFQDISFGRRPLTVVHFHNKITACDNIHMGMAPFPYKQSL